MDVRTSRSSTKTLEVLESIVTRSFIDLSTVTIDNEIILLTSKAGGVIDIFKWQSQKLSKDFSGLMNEVKGFRSDGLFVDETTIRMMNNHIGKKEQDPNNLHCL